MTRMLVIGAGGAVGEAIAHALAAAGREVVAAMRSDHPAAAARLASAGAVVRKLNLDCDRDLESAFENVGGAVLTPILTTSVRAARRIAGAGLGSVVFLSSNNVAVDPANPVYAALKDAEGQIREALPNAAILRPTLIYGDPRLPALSRLIRFLQRSPIVPIPGSGRVLQQPIFYEDLAAAAAALAQDPSLGGKTFAVGGPDIVSRREMFLLLSRLLGGVRVPVPAPTLLLKALRAVAPLPLDSAQIARLNADRIVVPVDPAPTALAPRVGLEEGLGRLIAELTRHEPSWRAASATA
jgi:NADH dehydrogenase